MAHGATPAPGPREALEIVSQLLHVVAVSPEQLIAVLRVYMFLEPPSEGSGVWSCILGLYRMHTNLWLDHEHSVAMQVHQGDGHKEQHRQSSDPAGT